MQFKLGYSDQPEWSAALDACLHQAGSLTNQNFGFVYVTDAFSVYLGKILDTLRQKSGVQNWVGSVGQGIACTRHEFYDQPAMVLMLADFAAESFEIFSNAQSDFSPPTSDAQSGVRFAVVHGDPHNTQLQQTINSLPDKIGDSYIVGGLTSATKHYFQVANEIVEGNLSGVVFNDQVEVITSLSQGSTPIGPVHRLTECDHHMAIRIDGRPALDVFQEDLGVKSIAEMDKTAGAIFAGFPLSDSDTNNYLIRNIVGIDTENRLLAIGEIMEAGSSILFCRQSEKAALTDMQRMLGDIKKRLAGRSPRGGLYISCLGRGRNLFGKNSAEMNIIADTLGDIPLVGFYANGEIAGHRLFGYTGVLTLFL